MVDDLTPPHWGTDEFVEPKPGDTFTCDQALSLAVTGYRVRAKDMQPGAYVDYQFAGWRINFPGGSSSGWTARERDYAAECEVVDPDPPKPAKDAWGRPNDPSYVNAVDKLIGATATVTVEQSKWGPPKIAKVEDVRDKWGKPI